MSLDGLAEGAGERGESFARYQEMSRELGLSLRQETFLWRMVYVVAHLAEIGKGEVVREAARFWLAVLGSDTPELTTLAGRLALSLYEGERISGDEGRWN